MFLKKLTINGFKSFSDFTEIIFDEGISAIVGPNGCGKSNIVDALKWVLGEQKTKALRAESMTDVIFKGTLDKKGLGRAEVRLVLANEENILPVDFSDVEISRIIYTNGDNEYYINKERVRLKDINELFFDTGVGKSAYSFMEQGKIDMILSTKPEDRRYIIEEAAGITKYKSRKNESLNKLARAEDNILRVQDILVEVTKQYETMKKQAEKAQKYTEIHDKEIHLEIEISVNRLLTQKRYQNEYSQKLFQSKEELDEIKKNIDSLHDVVSEQMVQLNQLEVEKIDRNREVIRLEGEIKTLNSRSSMLRDQVININALLKNNEEKILVNDRKIEEIEDEIEISDDSKYEIQEKIGKITTDMNRYSLNIDELNIDLDRINNLIQENDLSIKVAEELLAAKRNALKDVTDELIVKIENSLNSFDMNSQEIMDIKANAEVQIVKVVEELRIKRAFLSDMLVIEITEANSNDFMKKLAHFHEYLEEVEKKMFDANSIVHKYIQATGVFMNDIFSPEGVLQRKRKIEIDINEATNKIETLKIEIKNLSKEQDEKEEQKERYRELSSDSKSQISMLQEKVSSITRETQRLFSIKKNFEDDKNDLTIQSDSFKNQLEEIRESLAEIEEEHGICAGEKRSAEKRIEELDEYIQNENAKMSEQQKNIRAIEHSYQEKKGVIEQYTVKVAEVETTLQNIYEAFYENFSINLKTYENDEKYQTNREYSEIRKELTELKSEKSSLGAVNLLAIEEAKTLGERHQFLSVQLEDYREAKKDLLVVIDELNTISEELFVKTFHEVRKNFHTIFTKLFNGGNAEISLTMPDNILETGIDIVAQPPGQNSKSITLLSGGQRTMTAIALMFATFQVKPSPFCLLDEIDAALDEMNVRRLINLMEEFKELTQFVIVTHNKKTMSAASVLHGVTQESMGVSKIVSTKFIEKAV